MEHKTFISPVSMMVLSTLGHTWILDLDGTIVRHNGYKTDGTDTFLDGAEAFLHSLPPKDMILFLTSRPEEYRSQTERFLSDHGIRYDHIIFGAPYGERILINDNKPGGLCMSMALCRDRDKGSPIVIEEDPGL